MLLRNSCLGDDLTFLLGVAAMPDVGFSCSVKAEDVDGDEWVGALSLAEEALRGLRMSEGFLTQF